MQTFCPKCGTKLGADESLIGRQVQCGKCGNRFTVMRPDLSVPGAPETGAVAEKPSSELPPIGGALPPIGASPPAEQSAEKEAPALEKPAAPEPAATPVPPPLPVATESEAPAPPHLRKASGNGAKCPKCNADLLANAVLCTSCGTFLKQPEGGKPAKKEAPKWLKMVAMMVGLVGGGIGGWYASQLLFNKEEKPAPPPAAAMPRPGPQQPPGAPPTPGGPPGMPTPPGATPPSKTTTPKPAMAKVEFQPITPQEMEAMTALPAQDPAGSDGTAAGTSSKTGPLILRQKLTQCVSTNGPSFDRHQAQPNTPPKLSANTRLVTVQFVWQQDDLDQPLALNAETLRVTTDSGPGLLYGVEFSKFLSPSDWKPKGATADSSTVLEAVSFVTRRASDFTSDMLADGKLLARPAYTNWFEKIVAPMTRERLLVVTVWNQFQGANNRLETEQGFFFSPDSQLKVHLLLPTTARSFRLQFRDRLPMFFPLDALTSIPTTAQSDPAQFIDATLAKARVLLQATTPEEVVAGAQLLTEAGNLDSQNKLKPAAFNSWANSVTQLFANAVLDCRVAGVDALAHSQHVDAKLRAQLLASAVKNDSVSVRQRAAESLGEKPGILDLEFKEGMERLQALTVDSSPAVRAAAYASACRVAVLGDDFAFETQMETLQKGLKDPAPSVRAALLKVMPQLQFEGEKPSPPPQPAQPVNPRFQAAPKAEPEPPAVARLGQLFKYARLNLFDSSETVRMQAAKTILSVRSAASAAVVADALREAASKTADLFALASLEIPIGNAKQLSARTPALADPKVQAALMPSLAKLLDDPNPRKRQSAARVLGAFQADVANDALALAVKNSDLGVRLSALSNLNASDRNAPPPVAVFVSGLNDANATVQRATFDLLDQTLADPASIAAVASNVEASVTLPNNRLAVAQKFAAPAVTNAAVLLALSPFLSDKDENVWRAAIAPWGKTTLRLGWKEIAPIWNLLIQQQATSRRAGGFWVLRHTAAEMAKTGAEGSPMPPPEAVAEAAKLLSDPDPVIRESALVFVAPHRTAVHLDAIQKIVTDPKLELADKSRQQLLTDLGRSSTAEEFSVVDRLRPATDADKKKDVEALKAAMGTASVPQPGPMPGQPPPGQLPLGAFPPGGPPMPPGAKPPTPQPPAPAPQPTGTQTSSVTKATIHPFNGRIMVPTTSWSGIYLLTQWATSQNPAATSAANHLMDLVRYAMGRSWLLPSERASLVHSLRKLSDAPTVGARSKILLGQFEARFPQGQTAKILAPEQTQGAADSIESLLNFLSPKKKPVVIATYKSSSGVLIDIPFNADETIQPSYPPNAPAGSAEAALGLKFVSKADGTRVEPLDRDTLARLEWAAANASKEKLRAALDKLAQVEGDLGPLSRRVALEGLVLLAEQGDAEAEAEAVKLGWLKF